jgi:nitrite reductase/ring-hydroxylating ferredoxin subunit/uncharacterized membrane protein
MRTVRLVKLVGRLEEAAGLDSVVTPVRGAVNAVIRPRWLRDVLNGVPVGHPLHPALVQIPLGSWASAAALDAIPGTERAAKLLIGLGIAAAVPTALSGATDWTQLLTRQSRVGLVHAAANLLATGLYTVSLIQRRGNQPRRGTFFAYAGLAVVSVGGFLGGHLAYRQAAGVNHAEDVRHRVAQGWHPIGQLDEFADGALAPGAVEDLPLLVYRRGEKVSVLSDRCSHLSGPLHEGKLLRSMPGSAEPDACVVCPWHQSTFSLSTGAVVHGPATAPQPCFQTRVVDGAVEVRLLDAD